MSLATWDFQSLLVGEVWSTEANTAEVHWRKSLDGQSDMQFWWNRLWQWTPPKDCIFHNVTQDWRAMIMYLWCLVWMPNGGWWTTLALSWECVLSFQFVEGLLKRNKGIMGTGSKLSLLSHPTIHLLLPFNARAACLQAFRLWDFYQRKFFL